MKNAAKCDTSCDLQNPVNHQNFERILRFRDMPGSMLVGVSVDTTRHTTRSRIELVEADSACSGACALSAPNLVNETPCNKVNWKPTTRPVKRSRPGLRSERDC
eukprot:Plantae.Rhodophyta-Palmaria_palmata.ctg14036.p2 GENE.Plantae.Rhodophyta-Palmaria_palmata.ctg14036~~Plantae.Rhodophyta-Palmaria_palmata.ctg14036.p2  ORF type:complete len:104 (+),score=3.99 Plantae.Rhodophyta-Palmaria_palmata.ctg14036:64-375(+)